jgi:hypothetical protein
MDFWQSYSDLAMGVMAVFALIMILLLVQEKDESEKLRLKQEELLRLKARLEKDRREFAQQLAALLERAETTRIRQDRVIEWVRGVFASKDCRLALGSGNRLISKSSAQGERKTTGQGRRYSAAQLYQPGAVKLTAKSVSALRSCKEEFERMAVCLSPGRKDECLQTERSQPQAKKLGDLKGVLDQFRGGLEALVLQGNTDARPYLHKGKTPKLYTSYTKGGKKHKVRLYLKRKRARSFVKNAFLGSERARQALAHLLDLVSQDETRGAAAGKRRLSAPLEMFMSHLRIESPSFGLYQAGPLSKRLPGCGKAGNNGKCPAARNLALILRWKKKALRAPYEAFRAKLCDTLADPDSTFSQGLKDLDKEGKRRKQLLERYCKRGKAGAP